MDLGGFLSSARAAGHTKMRIDSPRGYELHRGALEDDAETVRARCAADASTLPADRRHEYIVFVTDAEGSKQERHSVHVAGGGSRGSGEHHVEPSTANTTAAVVGHLVRGLIDMAKQNVALSTLMSQRNSEEVKEAGKMRRAYIRSAAENGEVELTRLLLEQERESAKVSGDNLKGLLSEGLGLAKMVLGRTSPEAAASALQEAKDSLTDEQHEQAADLFGVGWARILSAGSPDAVVRILRALPQEKVAAFMGLLNDQQKQLFVGALHAAFERVKVAATNAKNTEANAS